jgi:hypothetical protein
MAGEFEQAAMLRQMNLEFASVQRKLAACGYLNLGVVEGDGSKWLFNFEDGKRETLLAVQKFLQDAGTSFTWGELACQANRSVLFNRSMKSSFQSFSRIAPRRRNAWT